jgi:hypothetical protein
MIAHIFINVYLVELNTLKAMLHSKLTSTKCDALTLIEKENKKTRM